MPSKLTPEQFIELARAVHGDAYDYSRARFLGTTKPIEIVCRHHGSFWLKAAMHIYFGGGCPKCRESQAQADYVARCQATHSDRYDYSRTIYRGMHKPVEVVCHEHGSFRQQAQAHLRGNGCPTCGGTKKLTKAEFVRRARAKHGDRYDYGRVDYRNARDKVIILCPEHGPFEQVPYSHLIGNGCAKCAGTVKKDTATFVREARAVHGSRYDYRDAEYGGANRAVTIVCPSHGPFKQSPSKHIGGANGCPKCGSMETGRKRRKSIEAFKADARSVHGDRFDYSLVEYESLHKDVTIICPVHGKFRQLVSVHIHGKAGCPKCSAIKRGRAKAQRAANAFAKRASQVHAGRYSYERVSYKTSRENVEILCPVHGSFWQQPSNHLLGNGCPSCASYGFNPEGRANLYYLRVATSDGPLYKVGVTNRPIVERFNRDLEKIEVIQTWDFAFGKEALAREREIVKTFRYARYEGPDILSQGGNTELFEFDVLGLDSRP